MYVHTPMNQCHHDQTRHHFVGLDFIGNFLGAFQMP